MSETLPRFNALRTEDQAPVARRFSAEAVRAWCGPLNPHAAAAAQRDHSLNMTNTTNATTTTARHKSRAQPT